jgi:two-component system nitrate/nitrite response regulator NarL
LLSPIRTGFRAGPYSAIWLQAVELYWRKKMQSQPLLQSVRVLIADSSLIHSQLLAETLAKDQRINVVGFNSSPDNTLINATDGHPDVLLISACLEEQPRRGLDVVRELRAERDSLKSVVLLDSSKPEIVVESFRSGACGVFCRNSPVEALPKCILAVHDGQIWANSRELGYVLKALSTYRSFQTRGNNALLLLSKREQEVVRCLADAMTNREIAERLEISEHTVKNYMFKIFEKLGVASRVELIFYVLSRENENYRKQASLSEQNIVATLQH